MDLDLDLLASIASGGLGHWYEDQKGAQSYVKDDDCVGKFKFIVIVFLNSSITLAFTDVHRHSALCSVP
jgi:hypothetical protein